MTEVAQCILDAFEVGFATNDRYRNMTGSQAHAAFLAGRFLRENGGAEDCAVQRVEGLTVYVTSAVGDWKYRVKAGTVDEIEWAEVGSHFSGEEPTFGDPEVTWVHRIDAVPEVGRWIEFQRGDEPPRKGRVVRPSPTDSFFGTGDDVRIKPTLPSAFVLLIPSRAYDRWRYCAAPVVTVEPGPSPAQVAEIEATGGLTVTPAMIDAAVKGQAIRQLLDDLDADYKRAGMSVTNKDRAGRIASFLIGRARERGRAD